MNRNGLRKRLQAISASLCPPHSLAARMADLSDEQRREWGKHQYRVEQWHNRCASPAEQYAALVNGDCGPSLRHDVYDALHGPVTEITADMSVEQAFSIYEKAMKGF